MEQEFITIKKVQAIDMPADVAASKGYDTKGRTGDGVEVTNEDGFRTWCPLSVFQQNNFPIFNETLASTCRMMMSEDYRERFLAEYRQLENRYASLKTMLEKWDKNEISFVPTCPRNIYKYQLKAMETYLDVLLFRAMIEDIEL